MRRVALGSGLELNKLADTIRQVASTDPPVPVLVCQAEANADAWIHLSITRPGADDLPAAEPVWVLILGYPHHENLEALLAAQHIALPAGSLVEAWKPGLHATIHLPLTASPEDIARSIQDVMRSIQNVNASAPVELTLEYA